VIFIDDDIVNKFTAEFDGERLENWSALMKSSGFVVDLVTNGIPVLSPGVRAQQWSVWRV